ncbi:hypothetical protein SUDANB176_07698 (plasmid) [Streptomyces sp. enrichment culture]
MTTKSTARGWDRAVFQCGRCGAEHTTTSEEARLALSAAVEFLVR